MTIERRRGLIRLLRGLTREWLVFPVLLGVIGGRLGLGFHFGISFALDRMSCLDRVIIGWKKGKTLWRPGRDMESALCQRYEKSKRGANLPRKIQRNPNSPSHAKNPTHLVKGKTLPQTPNRPRNNSSNPRQLHKIHTASAHPARRLKNSRFPIVLRVKNVPKNLKQCTRWPLEGLVIRIQIPVMWGSGA